MPFGLIRKYPTLILPGNGRAVRFKTLGSSTPRRPSSAASFTPSLPAGLGKNSRQPTASFSFLGKRSPAGFPACGLSTFLTCTRWGRCRKSPGIQAMLCGRISASWTNGRAGGFIFKNHIEDRGQLAAIRQKTEDEIAVLIKQRQKLYRYEPGSPQIGVLTEQLKKASPHRQAMPEHRNPFDRDGEAAAGGTDGRTTAAGTTGKRRTAKGSPKSRKTKEMIV